MNFLTAKFLTTALHYTLALVVCTVAFCTGSVLRSKFDSRLRVQTFALKSVVLKAGEIYELETQALSVMIIMAMFRLGQRSKWTSLAKPTQLNSRLLHLSSLHKSAVLVRQS